MRTLDRRELIRGIAGAAVGASIPCASLRASESRDGRSRRLLYNCDGSMIHCFGRAALGLANDYLNVEQFKSLVFSPIDVHAVDAMFFSFGCGNVAEYQSDVLEWPGEADRFQFPESRNWHGGMEVDAADQYRNPKALADAGHNPPDVIVEECHRRGIDAFVSFRMNDCHDGQHAKGKLPNPELATFKRQNPDWLVEDLDWWSALDYSHPRVRALKLRIIEEFFDRWDFDGIELDWLRHTLYFPRGTEREKGHHLTDLMRQIRRTLQAKAQWRGRPIEIAVRVPEKLAWCDEGGFDVAGWVREGLVDLLIVGQSVTELPTIGEFHELDEGRTVPVYGCLTPLGNGYAVSPDEVIRGSAARLWADGADGLCAFNWSFFGPWRRDLLGQIADPLTLRRTAQRLTFSHKVEVPSGEPGADYIRYNIQGRDAPLPVQLKAGATTTLVFGMGKVPEVPEERHSRGELFIGADFIGNRDVLRFELNGQPLEVPTHGGEIVQVQLGGSLDIPDGSGILGMAPRESVELGFRGIRLAVPTDALRSRRNELRVTLVERTDGVEHDLRLNRVEMDLA